MNLSTCWSGVEVERLCQVFVAVRNNAETVLESVWERWLLWRLLANEKLMGVLPHIRQHCCNQNHRMISWICDEPFSVTHRALLRMKCTLNGKSVLFSLKTSVVKGGQFLLLLSLHIWPGVFAICEPNSLFTYVEETNSMPCIQWAFWKCCLTNDVLCFWVRI